MAWIISRRILQYIILVVNFLLITAIRRVHLDTFVGGNPPEVFEI